MSKEPYYIVALPGDGIGPEVLSAALRVLRTAGNLFRIDFRIEEIPCGGHYYVEHETEWPDGSFEKCESADAIILGAVGHEVDGIALLVRAHLGRQGDDDHQENPEYRKSDDELQQRVSGLAIHHRVEPPVSTRTMPSRATRCALLHRTVSVTSFRVEVMLSTCAMVVYGARGPRIAVSDWKVGPWLSS